MFIFGYVYSWCSGTRLFRISGVRFSSSADGSRAASIFEEPSLTCIHARPSSRGLTAQRSKRGFFALVLQGDPWTPSGHPSAIVSPLRG